MATQNRRPKKYVTVEQLVDVILGIDHAMPIGLVTRTEPKMRKIGNEYFGRVSKITECNVFANCNYQNAVNRQREREGKEADFRAGERAFGDRVMRNGKGTPLIAHTGKDGILKRYVEVHFRGHLKTESRFVLDNRAPIDKALFREFLYEGSGAGGQGLDSEIVVRTYDVRNIVELRHGGTDYVVV